MKGRITCPNCGKHITAEINKEVPLFAMNCPICNHHFNVETSQVDCSKIVSDSSEDSDVDCDWEEHGEPRKTILSSIKPRTDKPMIASLLLTVIIIIAIFSALFPTSFLQAPVEIATLAGVDGTLTVMFDNESVLEANQVMLNLDQENAIFEIKNDSFHSSSLTLGEHILTITNIDNNASVTKDVYILPLDLSSYSITIVDTTPLKIENDSFELGWLSAILLILAFVTMISAFMCWKRRYSDVALICAIVGMLTIGFYFIGMILGIIAIILIWKSRDEFDDGKKGKSF